MIRPRDEYEHWRRRGRELGRRGLPCDARDSLPVRDDITEWLLDTAVQVRHSVEAQLAVIDEQARVTAMQLARTRELIVQHGGDGRLAANLPVLQTRIQESARQRAVTIERYMDTLETLLSQARRCDNAWRDACLEEHDNPPPIPAAVFTLPDSMTRPFPAP